LAYVPTDNIFIQVVATTDYPVTYRFYANVVSYDPAVGILILNAVNGLTSSFPFRQLRQFLVNIYHYIIGPTGTTGYTGPVGNIGPTGSSMIIGPTGIGSMVITNPTDTTSINYTNMVSVNSSSVIIQGYNLQMLTGIQEHVGYIDYTPYQITYDCNVYYITISGACTILLPSITSNNDGFYLYFRRVYYDVNTVTFSSGLDPDQYPTNIVSEGQYIGDAVYNYQCTLVGTASVRTFRVGTIGGNSYWFVNTA
jgi:hypothetical protein